MFRRITITTLSALLLAAVVAAPALAQGTPVPGTQNVALNVTSALTLTFTSGTGYTINDQAGQRFDVSNAVAWNVGSNDPAGYSLTENFASNFTSGSHTIAASIVSDNVSSSNAQDTTTGSSQQSNPLGLSPVVIFTTGTTSAPSGDLFSEEIMGTVPSSAFPGDYTTVADYSLIGN